MKKLKVFGHHAGMAVAVLCAVVLSYGVARAQSAPSALGTVKTVSGTTLTISTDKGQDYSVDASGTVSVLELAPGSTDLKTAQPGQLSSVAVGDRVLVTGTAGDAAGKLTARRVILMKAGDLAKQRQQEQMAWARGAGGLVTAVDPSAGTVTIATGSTTTAQQKTTIHTTPSTIYRRYASDSVKFEDAKAGKLSDIQVGDQLRVRGNKTGDSIQADEIISGTFKNIAGTITAVDASAGTVTLKDLGTKKSVLVKVTANSDLRSIPTQVAQRFAQSARPGAGGPGGEGGDAAGGGAPAGGFQRGGGGQRGTGGPGGAGGRRLGGGDLSMMIPNFPKANLADLHNGQALMITATQASPSSTDLTAVTVLSGVEPILEAAPTMSLTPGMGGGGGMEGGDMGGMGGGGGMQ